MNMGLTAEQIAERRNGVGGSDINILAKGDPDAIQRLIQIKRGEAAPDDLSGVLVVQMGIALEPLNAHWFTKATGRVVTDRNTLVLHPSLPWRRCNRDGLSTTAAGSPAYWEAKFTAGFVPLEDLIAKYQPQLHWGADLSDVDHAVLSILFGSAKLEVIEVACDPFYTAKLADLAHDFWRCVETGNPWPGYTPPKAPILVPATKRYDVRDQPFANEWGEHAGLWVANKAAAKKFDDAVKALKALMPDDAAECSGNGIKITRDKARKLSIKEI